MNDDSGKNTLEAFIIVIIGIILLLNNFDVLPWSIWQILFRFWPLLVISWGIKIAFGKNSFLYFISYALILFSIIFSVSAVSPKFDKWIENQIPQWKDVKNKIPFKYQEKGKKKIFRCDPITGKCDVYYR
jgi:hypothetical protein